MTTLLLPTALNLPQGTLDLEKLKSTLALKTSMMPPGLGLGPIGLGLMTSPLGAEAVSSCGLSVERTAGDSLWDSIIKLNNANALPTKPLPPLLVPRDQGVLAKCDTILENEHIACFAVGGEKRLCFPQVLNTVLRDFSLQDINAAVQKLNIHCSACADQQLSVFKLTGVLPYSATSCGLITKSDAERLCSFLLRRPQARNSNEPQPVSSMNITSTNHKPMVATIAKSGGGIPVAHECFGRCEGRLQPELYDSASAACIECDECLKLFAPEKFVNHSHRNHETRTCHWGFESTNWRSYLHLQTSVESDERLRNLLDQAKLKFNGAAVATPTSSSCGLKRPSEATIDSIIDERCTKRARLDDSISSTVSSASGFLPTAAAAAGNLVTDPMLLWYYMLMTSQKLCAQPLLPGAALAKNFLAAPPRLCANDLAQTEALQQLLLRKQQQSLGINDTELLREKEAQLIRHLLERSTKSTLVKQQSELTSETEAQTSSAVQPQRPTELKDWSNSKGEDEKHVPGTGTRGRVLTESDVASPDDSSTSSVEEAHSKHDDELTLDALLERHIWATAALKKVRQRIAENQSILETRVDSLSAENRVLQQEVAYLRRSLANCRPLQLNGSNCNIAAAVTSRKDSLLQAALTEIQRAASATALRI